MRRRCPRSGCQTATTSSRSSSTGNPGNAGRSDTTRSSIPFLDSRTGENASQADVAFVTADLVDSAFPAPQSVHQRPRLREGRGIADRESILDRVVVDPGEPLDETQLIACAAKLLLVVEIR